MRISPVIRSVSQWFRRSLKFRAGLSFVGPTEFDIARNSMHLIFAQTVVWLGHFFSPLLPLVFVLVLGVTFYMKKVFPVVNASTVIKRPFS